MGRRKGDDEGNGDGRELVGLAGIDKIREEAMRMNSKSDTVPKQRNSTHSYSHSHGRHSPGSRYKLQRNVWMRFGYRSGVSGRMWLGTQYG